jgi:hypothetical protein
VKQALDIGTPVPAYRRRMTVDSYATPCDHAVLDDPACTLPTAERPVRLGAWRSLLGTALSATSADSLTAEFHWPADAETAAAAADVATREVACCGFFRFGMEITDDSVVLRATVPTGHEPVVTGLLALARR